MNRFCLLAIGVSFSLISLAASRSEAATAPSRGSTGGVGNTYIEFAFMPIMKTTNDYINTPSGGSFPGEGDPGKSNTTGYDIRTLLGYAINGSWLVGLSYNSYSSTLKRDGTTTTTASTTVSEYGPAVGVLYGGWKLAFTYLLASEWGYSVKTTDDTGATSSDYSLANKGGSGYLVNFGYNFTVASWLQLGPSLIYRNMSYSKQSRTDRFNAAGSYTDQEFATKSMQSDLQPFFTIVARF